jgi:hypothetical protein
MQTRLTVKLCIHCISCFIIASTYSFHRPLSWTIWLQFSLGNLFVEDARSHWVGHTHARTHTHAHTHTHTHRYTISIGNTWTRGRTISVTSTWQHTTQKQQTLMPPAGFEPAFPVSERPQTQPITARPPESDIHITPVVFSYKEVYVESLPSRSKFFRHDYNRLWIGRNIQVPQLCAQQCTGVIHLMRRNFLRHFVQLTFVT